VDRFSTDWADTSKIYVIEHLISINVGQWPSLCINEQWYWFHYNNIRLYGHFIHSNDDTSDAECNELYSIQKVDVVYGSNANRWTKTIVLVCQTQISRIMTIMKKKTKTKYWKQKCISRVNFWYHSIIPKYYIESPKFYMAKI